MVEWANGPALRRILRPRALAAFLVLCTLGFVAVTGAVLWELRRQTWNNSMRSAENLLAAVAQDIGRNVELYDLSLRAVGDGLAMPGIDKLAPAIRQAILFDRAASAKYLGSILVLDETGRVVEDAGSLSPRPDELADRSYFKAHRDNPALDLSISAPFRRETSGQVDWAIALSRRINKPDGSFGGVIVGTLCLDYIKNLFDRFDLGRNGAVSLFRMDGTLLIRAPFDEATVGRRFVSTPIVQTITSAPSGRFVARASLDGVTRVFNFTRIGDLPLVLFVAQSPGDILAAWTRWATCIVAILAVMCIVTGTLARVCLSELRRRSKAEAIIRHREEELRLVTEHATDVIVRLDASLVRRYVSPSSWAVFGYPPEQLVGQDFRTTIYPEDRARVTATVEEARWTQGRGAATYRILRKDTAPAWVEGQFSAMPDNSGFIVLVRDVTARKAAERDLAEAHEELRRTAATDGLTGLANRRRFDETMKQEWRRAAREEKPLALLLLDVDHFKSFNDRYGHQEGDACLRAIARAMSGCARRASDLVARYGGEEFAVLLPDTEQPQAAALAERIRRAIANLEMPHEGNGEHGGILTASLGCATVIPTHRPAVQDVEDDIKSLIVTCDQALYAAKGRGRNRVAVHGADVPSLQLRPMVGQSADNPQP